jgi:pimeloyl-ACP methyl ester carboxylesterase
MPIDRIVLLPGMDGTGELLFDFSHALPRQMRKEIPTYPKDRVLPYEDLIKLVRSICQDSEPFVLLAESFSTPLAIQIAAERPKNLKALILCVGFASSPARGFERWLWWILAPSLMRAAPPDSVIRSLLIGAEAPEPLVAAVRKAISSVRSNVLAARLRAILECDVRSSLGQVNVPTLYLQARHDRLVKPRCLEEIRRVRPDIETATVDGPHLLLLREPQKAAAIVGGFLECL